MTVTACLRVDTNHAMCVGNMFITTLLRKHKVHNNLSATPSLWTPR